MSYSPEDTQLGRVLREHGLLQAEIASEAGISQPYLSQLASGKKTPSLEVALRLTAVICSRTKRVYTVESIFGTRAIHNNAA